VGKNGLYRSINRRLEHTIRMAPMRIRKFVEFADKITLPFSLDELIATKSCKKNEERLHARCKELERDVNPSRPYSGIWDDSKGRRVLCYLGERIVGEPAMNYALSDNHASNLAMQLLNRQERHLQEADRQGRQVVCDGLDVSFSFPTFVSFCSRFSG
jgi:hypothetical protein